MGWGTHVNPWLFHFNEKSTTIKIHYKKKKKCMTKSTTKKKKKRPKKKKNVQRSKLRMGPNFFCYSINVN